jgi:hypothetical protein
VLTQPTQPLLKPVRIDDLRPTQMTVGFREVALKRAEWRARAAQTGGEYLGHHMIPVILGPKNRTHPIDNHHLVRALHEEGVEEVLVQTMADLSHLTPRAFRTVMANRNWFHPYDAKGRRRGIWRLPKQVAEMADDPYRSLAGELRRQGAFAKDTTPYAEFLWADHMRARIPPEKLEKQWDKAMAKAMTLARAPDAQYLPGWSGPSGGHEG